MLLSNILLIFFIVTKSLSAQLRFTKRVQKYFVEDSLLYLSLYFSDYVGTK